jgi:hypothetical protein
MRFLLFPLSTLSPQKPLPFLVEHVSLRSGRSEHNQRREVEVARLYSIRHVEGKRTGSEKLRVNLLKYCRQVRFQELLSKDSQGSSIISLCPDKMPTRQHLSDILIV